MFFFDTCHYLMFKQFVFKLCVPKTRKENELKYAFLHEELFHISIRRKVYYKFYV